MKLHSLLALAVFGLNANARLLPRELKAEENYRKYGILPRRQPLLRKRQARRDMPVGEGDRFNGGTVPPRGLGIEDRDMNNILNPKEVESGLRGLASAFDDVKFFTAPYTTLNGNKLYGVDIKGDDPIRPRVFIQGGIHARERGGPDDIVYFLGDLLQARQSGTGLEYGNISYTNEDVVKALSAGIIALPLVNPDGVYHDQEFSDCWRKNRNNASTDNPDDYGVDLNRNFDFLWEFNKTFDSRLAYQVASDWPGSEIFHGTKPLSEPETKNIAWVFTENPFLGWYLDLHSFGGDILYSWGDDESQGTDPSQNFSNPAYDHKRGIPGNIDGNRYAEYITDEDLKTQRTLAERMSDAMREAGPTRYEAKETVKLYPISGGSTDYALSRFYGGRCGYGKTHGVTIEFGEESDAGPCEFYPSNEQYHNWMKEVSAGLMELLLTAADAGETETYKCY